MQPFGVLLLLLTCQLVTSTPTFDRDGASLHREYRSAVGDTIRDWFRILKNRVVGKLQEWFGNDGPTPTFTAQDILNIDKTIGSRISGYPGLFLDLSSLSFDPKQDLGVRIGNWYIIRKVTGYDYNLDSDSDEWLNGGDLKPIIPPSTSILGINWTPNWIPNVQGIPESIPPATTTPKIESTTLRQTTSQTVDETEAVVTSTEPHLTTSEEPTVTPAEPPSLTTRLITTFTDSIVATTKRILTSDESVVTNNESITSPTNSVLTSTVSDVNSTESTEFTVTSESTSSESSTESTATDIESVVTSTEETLTTTELPTTSTESILPIYNKRIEDNEIVTRRTTTKPRPASAEVIF